MAVHEANYFREIRDKSRKNGSKAAIEFMSSIDHLIEVEAERGNSSICIQFKRNEGEYGKEIASYCKNVLCYTDVTYSNTHLWLFW